MTRLIQFSCLWALLCTSVLGQTKNTDPKVGVFSNKAEGFYTISVFVNADGMVMYNAGLGLIVGKWTFQADQSILTITANDPASGQKVSFPLKFDNKTRSYTILEDSGIQENRKTLYHIQDEIPAKVLEIFEKVKNSPTP